MFCTQCGAQLAADAKFCSKCGRPVASSSANNETPQHQAPERVASEASQTEIRTEPRVSNVSTDDEKALKKQRDEAEVGIFWCAVACAVTALIGLYGTFFGPNDAFHIGALISTVVFGVLAWAVWAKRSRGVTIVAAILLVVQAIPMLIVAVLEVANSDPNTVPSTVYFLGFGYVLLALNGAWRGISGAAALQKISHQR
jgi:hypothetical protein